MKSFEDATRNPYKRLLPRDVTKFPRIHGNKAQLPTIAIAVEINIFSFNYVRCSIRQGRRRRKRTNFLYRSTWVRVYYCPSNPYSLQ